MQWCKEAGISHSKFLKWSVEDRSKALAFLIEENSKCSMCGTADWEWDGNKRAYVPVDIFCMGCYLKHMSNEGSDKLPGTTVSLIPSNSRKHHEMLWKEKAANERSRREC